MRSIISQTVIKLLIPLYLIFSFYMLFRGHNEPGGGFIGGLLGTIVFILYGMIFGMESFKKHMPFDPQKLITVGLTLITMSGLFAFFSGQAFMTGQWAEYQLPFFGKPGSPILFDIGIYVLVMGVVFKITITMFES